MISWQLSQHYPCNYGITGTALGGCYEATKLLGGSLGSKRPGVSPLERKETNSMTSDASKKHLGKQGCNCQFCKHKIFNPYKTRSVNFCPSALFMCNCIDFYIVICCQFVIHYSINCFVFIAEHFALLF